MCVGGACLVIAFAAHTHGRPITAALLAVLGVTVVGALLGVRAGLLAGIFASLTYNLLLTDPVLKFSLASLDDLVPIIALNLSAIASGSIAGRLHDRALAAEHARQMVSELLAFSQSLQGAVTLEQIQQVAHVYLGDELHPTHLFVEHNGRLRSPGSPEDVVRAAEEIWTSNLPQLRVQDLMGLVLTTGQRRLGLLVLPALISDAQRTKSFLPLLTLAVQRWLLSTELNEADAIRRSEVFKTALLSSVSHDLRSPLAAIAASATSLSAFDDALDAETKQELLITIREQSERLDRLTTNLLNIGRIEGGLDVDRMPVIDAVESLGAALSRVRQLHPHHAFEKNFQVQSAAVKADEALLEQVLMNVCANAAVHTPPGTKVRVSAAITESKLTIRVEDNGPGIPASDRERVFERFYQSEADGRPRSGSGLGLSIAKGFTETIGGTIKASAAEFPMTGADIQIVLPLTEFISA